LAGNDDGNPGRYPGTPHPTVYKPGGFLGGDQNNTAEPLRHYIKTNQNIRRKNRRHR